VLYGDHYGVSDGRNPQLAPLVDKDTDTWDDYDNAQMQRVPFMVHVPGQEKGGISHTYGGEVDVLPTLLHLLGVPTDNYIQLGQDLLSNDHDQIVAFRNGSFMTPEYTFYNQTLYNNETQRPITLPDDEFETLQQKAQKQLDISDKINNGDLLRFNSIS